MKQIRFNTYLVRTWFYPIYKLSQPIITWWNARKIHEILGLQTYGLYYSERGKKYRHWFALFPFCLPPDPTSELQRAHIVGSFREPGDWAWTYCFIASSQQACFFFPEGDSTSVPYVAWDKYYPEKQCK